MFGGMGNFGRLQPAQFVGVGKLVEAFQAEELEEKRRRFVEKRPARLLGTAGHADHLPLQQRRDHAIDGHTAHRFDFGAADGLAVGGAFGCSKSLFVQTANSGRVFST